MTMKQFVLTSLITLAALTSSAWAVPTTYTFTGTLNASHVSTSGTLAGLFNAGDTFTLTSAFDLGAPPDSQGTLPTYRFSQWFSGNSLTLSINGETYSIGESSGFTGFDSRYAEAAPGLQDFIRMWSFDNTTDYTPNAGNATSTLALVDFVYIRWDFIDNDGLNDIVNYANPDFPASTNLSDWRIHDIDFILRDLDTGGEARIDGGAFSFSGAQVFDSLTIATHPVPAPGALVLMSFGIFALVARRRAA